MKNTSGKTKNRLFTVEQANATLPLVEAITADLTHLTQQMSHRRRQLDYLMYDRKQDNNDPYDAELIQAEKDLQQQSHQIKEFAAELQQLGVASTDNEKGLVDFPAEIEGRPAFLCWKLGEPEVRYWREKSTDTRTPLPGETGKNNRGTGPASDVN